MQRQYQEQCSFSEKYRSDLRVREELIRTLHESASLHELEGNKWAREQQGYEERITQLEEELNVAQAVYVQLDEQKQENLLLKETIDRVRFEMDEMRANAALGLPPGGGTTGPGILSKTLGAELMGKMQWNTEGPEGPGKDKETEERVEEGGSLEVPDKSEDESGASATAVEEDDDTEDEDVIQTIITRTKRVRLPSHLAILSADNLNRKWRPVRKNCLVHPLRNRIHSRNVHPAPKGSTAST